MPPVEGSRSVGRSPTAVAAADLLKYIIQLRSGLVILRAAPESCIRVSHLYLQLYWYMCIYVCKMLLQDCISCVIVYVSHH